MFVRSASRIALFLSLVALAFPVLPAAAAIWRVNPAGTGDAPTIQAAVNAAADGDEILLADGTFTGTGNREVDVLGKQLVIRSESGVAAACIIDLEDACPTAFNFDDGEGPDTELADVTITRGDEGSIYVEGAIDIADSSPTIRNVRITESWVGVHCDRSSSTFENVEVRDGGLSAIELFEGVHTLTGCVLESNIAAVSMGSALWLLSSDVTVDGCVIRGCGHTQQSADGRGIGIGRGVSRIRDTEIVENVSCGIYASSAWTGFTMPYPTVLLERCTITDNVRYGVRFHPQSGKHGELVVRDCVFRDNGRIGLYAEKEVTLTVEDSEFVGHS
jgi:hypothetical protein